MENGYFNQKAFNGVVLAGNVEMMEWCEQNGAVFDDKTFYVAAHSGKIEALEWLKLNECPWGDLTLEYARYNVTRNVMNWLQKNGYFNFNEDTDHLATSIFLWYFVQM